MLGIVYNFVVSENGCELVMDYLYLIIMLDGDSIFLDDVYDVGMGVWDDYVIVYGYQDFVDDIDEDVVL